MFSEGNEVESQSNGTYSKTAEGALRMERRGRIKEEEMN